MLEDYSPNPDTSPFCNNVNSVFKTDLSIIIPAFNVEKYITECIESIINQRTNFTFQVLIINDGSSDSTKDILNYYEENYSFVKVIHQENRGFSGARNRGLEKLDSKYVMFVDSDDMIDDDSIDNLLKAAYETNADIVQGNYEVFDDDTSIILSKTNFCDGILSKDFDLLPGFMWGKIYKSSIFYNIHFPEKFWFEDSILSWLIYPSSNAIVTIEKNVYRYRSRNNSISKSSKYNSKCVDTFWITKKMISCTKHSNYSGYNYLRLLIHQIAINYKRTQYTPEHIQRCIFVLSKDFFEELVPTSTLDYFDEELLTAINIGNYARYKYLCRIF